MAFLLVLAATGGRPGGGGAIIVVAEPSCPGGVSVIAAYHHGGASRVLCVRSEGVPHVNFDEIKNKALDLAEEHHDKVDQGIDAAANFASQKFGHDEQIDSVAEKIKDMLPGGQ